MFEAYMHNLQALVAPPECVRTLPEIDDRAAWESLHADQKKYFFALAKQYKNYTWPILSARRYLDYVRDGNRSRYTAIENERRRALLCLCVAEGAENKGNYLDDIITGVWTTLDEYTWIGPAHNSQFPPIPPQQGEFRPLPPLQVPGKLWIDHYAGDTGCILAAVYRIFKKRFDAVDPQICQRILFELRRRIIEPFLQRDDMPWMGRPGAHVNNWLPWVTSNVLAVTLYAFDDPALRAAVMEKACVLLERIVDVYFDDGGCDEGPRYWGICSTTLFGALELLYDMTGGKIDLFGNKKLYNIVNYANLLHIGGRYYANFADSESFPSLDYQRIYFMAKRFGCADTLRLAVYNRPTVYGYYDLMLAMHFFSYSFFRNLFTYKEYRALHKPSAPFWQDGWCPGIQVFAARSTAGSQQGLYLAGKGGHNGESHNHNDIGTYILYSDGNPVVMDIGAGDYTAKSFSSARYTLPHVNSGWHNLPAADGVQQCPGTEFCARDVHYEATGKLTRFCLDIAPAYPADGPIAAWKRGFAFDRGTGTVTVTDDFTLTHETADIEIVLMTAQKPQPAPGGLLLPAGIDGAPCGKAVLAAFSPQWSCTTQKLDLQQDCLMQRDWNGAVYRTVFTPARAMQSGSFTMTFTQFTPQSEN